MSKRLTSLLVGAFAVLMLGTTAQAQAVMKRENPVKDLTAYCQKLTLKVNLASNPEFQKLDPRQQERVLLDVQEKKAEGKLTLNARPFNGAKASKRNASPSRLMAPRNAEETYLGIIVEPAEGVHNFYTREGMSYVVYNQQVYSSEQSGYAEVVFTIDSTRLAGMHYDYLIVTEKLFHANSGICVANHCDLSDVQQSGTLRLGIPPDYIPFVFIDESGNNT